MESRNKSCLSLFPCLKAAGEWVEMVFMVKAAALRLAISKPYGDSQRYDFLVNAPRKPALRVQIKSAFSKLRDYYTASARGSSGRYDPSELDFLVIYIPPEDAWYVVPSDCVHANSLTLRPHRSRGKYEKYRDAWHLITGETADDTRALGFTIHASRSD